jgi:hypothetical protein
MQSVMAMQSVMTEHYGLHGRWEELTRRGGESIIGGPLDMFRKEAKGEA